MPRASIIDAMTDWLNAIIAALALPQVGLSTVFFIAFIASTLLPLGSEPAVFALVKLNPEMFWPAIWVATAGATLGGAITWWMGYGAERAYEHMTHKHRDGRALRWLRRFGPKACLLSWLPVVGDPLCAVAGWLQLPFWPCLSYMAIGKFGQGLDVLGRRNAELLHRLGGPLLEDRLELVPLLAGLGADVVGHARHLVRDVAEPFLGNALRLLLQCNTFLDKGFEHLLAFGLS